MDKKAKQTLFIVITGIVVFVALINLPLVIKGIEKAFSLLLPIVVGLIMAVFINVPVNGVERLINRIFKNKKKKPSEKSAHIIAFITAMLLIILVLTAVFVYVIPELAMSVKSLYDMVNKRVPGWIDQLNRLGIDSEWLTDAVSSVNVDNIMKNVTQGVSTVISSVFGVISSTVSAVVTASFALIISVYIILGKKNLARQSRRLAYAYLKKSWADNIFRFCGMFGDSFSKFLSGQCVEAVILGSLLTVIFLILKLPYAYLVGVFTAVCALIPYIGAFLSCAVSVLLTLIADPSKALMCLIVYLCVQFAESQFIYPHVVGNSVGMSPFFTLLAALIGGKLFGIIGILFFIPLTSVALALIKENVNRRIKNKIPEAMISSENGEKQPPSDRGGEK